MAVLAFELIHRFLWGSLVVMLLASRHETSERFLKVASGIAVGVVGFMTLLWWAGDLAENHSFGTSLLFGAWSLVIGFIVYWRSTRAEFRALATVVFVFSPVLFLEHLGGTWGFRDLLNFVLSGLVFGGVFGGQFLGHWYLTVAGLHIKELSRVVRLMNVAFVLKAIELLLGLIWLHLNPLEDPNPWSMSSSLFSLYGEAFGGLGSYGLLLVGTRVLWGIVAPLGLGWMVAKTVQTRSTQSATGILYAMSVLVILGEAMALYLKHQLGLYL